MIPPLVWVDLALATLAAAGVWWAWRWATRQRAAAPDAGEAKE